jgi:multidrug efflux pump
MQSVTDTLNDAFGQRQISTIYGQANQYRVILEAQPRYQQDPASLGKLYVTGSSTSTGTAATVANTASGTTNTNTTATPNTVTGSNQVPLAAFARFVNTSAPLVIAHQEQFPSITISFDLARGYALSDAVTLITDAQLDIGMPPTVTGSYSGDAAEFAKSLTNEVWLLLAAAIAIYIVLGVLYESFIHPLTILSTLPSAGVGALLALMLFGYDLSVIALIGIVPVTRRVDCAGRPASFPPDHDDDARRLVRCAAAGAGKWHRLGAAQSARRHHRRRLAAQPVADALHHAGDLSLHGAAACASGAGPAAARTA